jgi:hypothetical protein
LAIANLCQLQLNLQELQWEQQKLTQLQQQRQTEIERLSKMIRKQANQAQFLVVSLRRPMIEAADRKILQGRGFANGVTQARGAYTQVLGINLKTSA